MDDECKIVKEQMSTEDNDDEVGEVKKDEIVAAQLKFLSENLFDDHEIRETIDKRIELMRKDDGVYLYSHIMPITCLTQANVNCSEGVSKYNHISLKNVHVVDVYLKCIEDENGGYDYQYNFKVTFYGEVYKLFGYEQAKLYETTFPTQIKRYQRAS